MSESDEERVSETKTGEERHVRGGAARVKLQGEGGKQMDKPRTKRKSERRGCKRYGEGMAKGTEYARKSSFSSGTGACLYFGDAGGKCLVQSLMAKSRHSAAQTPLRTKWSFFGLF